MKKWTFFYSDVTLDQKCKTSLESQPLQKSQTIFTIKSSMFTKQVDEDIDT
jgi:hypothetical protein